MAKNKSSKRRKIDDAVNSRREGDEPKFRLRPPSARAATRGDMGWSIALRTVFRYAKSSAKSRKSGAGPVVRSGRRSYLQRCAVRVTYSPNKTTGQWRAHGIYIARESASGKRGNSGFEANNSQSDIAAKLGRWQNEGDERIWKVILSPEFGDRVDLERMTREVMKRSERQLETALEWVAVTHFNTEHPHVHLVIRGRRDDDSPLNLPRDFIKQGLRELAAEACTLQLGPRTELDAAFAQEREIAERRYTSLDRALAKRAVPADDAEDRRLRISLEARSGAGKFAVAHHKQNLHARLIFLRGMGLAERQSSDAWLVHGDFATVLRAMQLASDRQKMLSANGALLSDPRLRLNVLDFRNTPEVQGRVLVHGEEEQASGRGRHYLLLEGTDAQVHMAFYTPEMEIARSAGRLRPNSFVRLRRARAEYLTVRVEDLGNAEALLKNKAFLRSSAQRLIRQGLISTEGWGGWLGRYHAAVRETAGIVELEGSRSRPR